AAAEQLTREAALAQLLGLYLPAAGYVAPSTLAKHLGLPEPELRSALDRFVAGGDLAPAKLEGQRGQCYVWQGKPSNTSRSI
ncbi:MAG TPA: crosslink repair DNA glycosylase YcaQ family protein, partial [Nitrolancea sp.]